MNPTESIFLSGGDGKLCPRCQHHFTGLVCPCFEKHVDEERQRLEAKRFLHGEIALPMYDVQNQTHIKRPLPDPKVRRAWCGAALTAKSKSIHSVTRFVSCKDCMEAMRRVSQ